MKLKTEQIPVMITKAERKMVEELAEELNGSRGQVFRLALAKFYKEKKDVENGKSNK